MVTFPDEPEIYDPIPDCPVCHGYGYHRKNGIHCVCVFIKPEDRGKFVTDYITAQHKAHERIFVTRPPLYAYPPWSDNVDPAFLSLIPPPPKPPLDMPGYTSATVPPPPTPLSHFTPFYTSELDWLKVGWRCYTAIWVLIACFYVALLIASRLGPR